MANKVPLESLTINEEEPQLQSHSGTHNGYSGSFTHHSGNEGNERIPDRMDAEELSTDIW